MGEREKPESLADYVRRVRIAKNLSQGDIERQSARRGTKIAGTYVSRIESGIATNPSPRKLLALANGLGVPREEIFATVQGRAPTDPSTQEQILLRLFRELPSERQEDLLGILRSLHQLRSVQPGQSKNHRGSDRAA